MISLGLKFFNQRMGIINSTNFIAQMNLSAGQEDSHRHRDWICGHRGPGLTHTHTTMCKTASPWEAAV